MTITIGRRKFISALSGAAATPVLWPLAAHAQQPSRVRRIGVFSHSAAAGAVGWTKGLQQNVLRFGS
jgi:hypothetical protein